MSGVNKVILIGNLGKDPEIRHLEGGVSVAKFPLATTEIYKNKEGQKVEQTEWHNVVMWRGLADVAEKLLKKGNQVYIEGKLRTRSWDDKDGHKKYITEVMADNMTLLTKRNVEDPNGSSAGHYNSGSTETSSVSTSTGDNVADDLPF